MVLLLFLVLYLVLLFVMLGWIAFVGTIILYFVYHEKWMWILALCLIFCVSYIFSAGNFEVVLLTITCASALMLIFHVAFVYTIYVLITLAFLVPLIFINNLFPGSVVRFLQSNF